MVRWSLARTQPRQIRLLWSECSYCHATVLVITPTTAYLARTQMRSMMVAPNIAYQSTNPEGTEWLVKDGPSFYKYQNMTVVDWVVLYAVGTVLILGFIMG